jgi:hypothetical protein
LSRRTPAAPSGFAARSGSDTLRLGCGKFAAPFGFAASSGFASPHLKQVSLEAKTTALQLGHAQSPGRILGILADLPPASAFTPLGVPALGLARRIAERRRGLTPSSSLTTCEARWS